ncbi:MAG: DUF2799 domain-containing protein [Gammaproteobacteria bacterium]|nr:DUF2799 domain-containing protein [Gammaproteobacteria bacterium]
MKAGDDRFSSPIRYAIRVVPVLSLLLLMQGCASLNKEECMVADWRLIGYQDGVAGKSPAAVGEYRKDCAKHAVVPDLDAYQAGRNEGLLEYCKVDNGYRLGTSGRGLSTVCPSHLEAAFRVAWNQGRELYQARAAVKQTHSQINKQQQALHDLEEDKKYKLSELVSEGLRSEQRVLILYEISEIKKKKDAVENEIDALHYELSDRQTYLDSLNQQASR